MTNPTWNTTAVEQRLQRGLDYLAEAERLIEGPQYKDGPEYVADYIQLGIGQQLRELVAAVQAKPRFILAAIHPDTDLQELAELLRNINDVAPEVVEP